MYGTVFVTELRGVDGRIERDAELTPTAGDIDGNLDWMAIYRHEMST